MVKNNSVWVIVIILALIFIVPNLLKKTAVITCTDSDNGQILNIKGITTDYLDGELYYTYTDTCYDTTTLDEGYCLGGVRLARTSCPSGQLCNNGVCGQTGCTPNNQQYSYECDDITKDIYYYNNCGYKTTLKEDCTNGCYSDSKICTPSDCIIYNEICDGKDNDCDGSIDELPECDYTTKLISKQSPSFSGDISLISYNGYIIDNTFGAEFYVKNNGASTKTFLIELQPKSGQTMSVIEENVACDPKYPQNVHTTVSMTSGQTKQIDIRIPKVLGTGKYDVYTISYDSCCNTNPNCNSISPFFDNNQKIATIEVTSKGAGVCQFPQVKCPDGTCKTSCSTTTECGDGACNGGETTTTCPADCKPSGSKCGDGVCNSGETTTNCPSDCKKPDTTCEFYQDPKDCTKIAMWVWIVGVLFGLMMLMMMMKKR